MIIDNFKIDETSPVMIVAELSANHNGNIELAKNTIKAAKRAGADAIKLQTYTADTITIDCNKDDFIIKGTIWEGENYHSLYKKAYTPWEWHDDLFKTAKDEGLICFSTPFDFSSVDFLETLNVPLYKIASFEITDIPLIYYIAKKGKPIILSTGIADLDDINLAIKTCLDAGNDKLIILKCTSSYPAPIDEANLTMIRDLKHRFGFYSGISDHTIGNLAPILSVSYGAKVIEKHFIIDRSTGGPDSSFSMNENEFKNMVNAVRDAEKAIGTVNYKLTEKQKKGRDFSKSLYVVKDVLKGTIVSEENIRSIRPGFGLHPKYYNEVIGKKFNKDLFFGDRLTLNDLI